MTIYYKPAIGLMFMGKPPPEKSSKDEGVSLSIWFPSDWVPLIQKVKALKPEAKKVEGLWSGVVRAGLHYLRKGDESDVRHELGRHCKVTDEMLESLLKLVRIERKPAARPESEKPPNNPLTKGPGKASGQ